MTQYPAPSLDLHAELLPNIRQVTLYISPPDTPQLKNRHPEIHLSDSRRAVTVSYGDVSETIKLPARVSEAARVALRRQDKLGEGGKEVSYRMQIDASEESASGEMVDEFVPWTAGGMTPVTKVRCRACGSVVLDSPASAPSEAHAGPGWTWKDLPSGNWAEMMDFWHCHKPDPPKDDHGSAHGQDANGAGAEDPNALVKGYGAANRVVAAPGIVLVDVASFLVAEVDCLGLKKVDSRSTEAASSSTPRAASITCSKCDSLIGMEDIPSNGWRLLKANLAVNTQPDKEQSTWASHPVETLVAAQFLELVERESARRIVVHRGGKTGLLLWIFNPNLRYSSSSAHQSVTAQQAMKVLFQDVFDIDVLLGAEQGKATPLSVEELELPERMFAAVSRALVERSSMLPLSARRFREWRVGLLHRFERKSR